MDLLIGTNANKLNQRIDYFFMASICVGQTLNCNLTDNPIRAVIT